MPSNVTVVVVGIIELMTWIPLRLSYEELNTREKRQRQSCCLDCNATSQSCYYQKCTRLIYYSWAWATWQPRGEILEQTSSTPSFGTLRFHLQKTVGPSLVRNLPCSTCVTSVPIHCQFSQYCYHRLLMLFLNTQSPPLVCGYYWPSWPFLPLLNKYIII